MLNEDEELAASLVYSFLPKKVLAKLIAEARRGLTAEQFEQYKKTMLEAWGDKQ